ncbi:PTS glucose transporter subunit IIA [Lactobacillus curvatus]|nr:PTS glucose transporter subunit IIA [Latilactobacillus curvatus]MSE24013.1 PTS glucose transporter subunit IIA [Latilactobacillus curvatus]
MKLFARKPKKLELHAIADGTIIPLQQVTDAVFSTKMMGDGFALNPSDSHIYSPVDGVISSIFPTKHALGITTKTGVELLLHLGLDTVELNGAPFTIYVQEGDTVTTDQLLVEIDLAALASANKEATCMVVVTNMDDIDGVNAPLTTSGHHGEVAQIINL